MPSEKTAFIGGLFNGGDDVSDIFLYDGATREGTNAKRIQLN